MAVNVKFTLAGLTAGGFQVYGGQVGLFPLESEASSPTDLAAMVRECGSSGVYSIYMRVAGSFAVVVR